MQDRNWTLASPAAESNGRMFFFPRASSNRHAIQEQPLRFAPSKKSRVGTLAESLPAIHARSGDATACRDCGSDLRDSAGHATLLLGQAERSCSWMACR